MALALTNLGPAPFRYLGYAKMEYQACPGAPIQPGASCDLCGQGIKHVHRIKDGDGNVWKVGSDCVEKISETNQAYTRLIVLMRTSRKVAEKVERDRKKAAVKKEAAAAAEAHAKALLEADPELRKALTFDTSIPFLESLWGQLWKKGRLSPAQIGAAKNIYYSRQK